MQGLGPTSCHGADDPGSTQEHHSSSTSVDEQGAHSIGPRLENGSYPQADAIVEIVACAST